MPILERLEQRHVMQGIPVLHSKLDAAHSLFLDFDGHVTERTSWNLEFQEIHSPAFDVNGDVDHIDRVERDTILSIWERMAEDFRPFDVNVTTVDPSHKQPEIFVLGGLAQRVVFTSKIDIRTGEAWYQGDELGVATRSWYEAGDTPAFVFSTHRLAGEIGSHEAGHAIGLSHDSEITSLGKYIEYRGEHGSGETRWSPIMGQGNVLSQWSDGTYPNATNTEPDIGLLAMALGRRPDDYPVVYPLPESSSINVEGIIEHAADTDTFL